MLSSFLHLDQFLNLDQLLHFLHMGGYGFYVWGAYGSVLVFLLLQWFFPWRRWRRYLQSVGAQQDN
jgi:heme exporter protein CcmD